jgi:hypothetical protein
MKINKIILNIFLDNYFSNYIFIYNKLGIGDWGLGIGDW